MTRYVSIALLVCACAVLATADYNLGLGFSDGYLTTNFGSPTLNALSTAGARDPRANTGPVVFPLHHPGTHLSPVASSSGPQDTASNPQVPKVP